VRPQQGNGEDSIDVLRRRAACYGETVQQVQDSETHLGMPVASAPTEPHRLSRLGWMSLAIFGCALLALPRFGHVDDSDAAVYQVIVRNMVADRAWFDLRYLPAVHPHFHEHLPFGFWPAAAAVRLFGEGAIPWVSGLETLLLLVCAAWLAQRLSNGLAGAAAFVVLATTGSVFVLGPTARLDSLLMLLTLVSVLPLVAPVPRYRPLGILAAALATLVKGPFGVLPWFCASAARAIVDRKLLAIAWGILGAALGLLPAAAFLLWNRLAGDGAWWEGYGKAQLLASVVGSRPDGLAPFWYPLVAVGGRFWPGLPLAAAGFAFSIRRRDPRLWTVALTCVFILFGLMLPARKVWNHSLIVFPVLAVLSGMVLSNLMRRVSSRAVERAALGLALASIVAVALGAGRLWRSDCVAAGPLHAQLARLPAGTPIATVSEFPSWLTVGSLAAELRLTPAPAGSLAAIPARYSWAVVEASRWVPGAWREIASGAGWILAERRVAASRFR
jgi:4-amino-4-deoxy-L-arabinose transferase-like glycosyltransferase